jgi:putative phage-type endonuclease
MYRAIQGVVKGVDTITAEGTMEYPKTREEWLALRHKHISSTEVAALFGLSPYATAFEVAVMKQAPTPDDREIGDRAEWGLRLQRSIAGGIADKYGVKVRAISGYAVHSYEHCRMGASFDYEIVGLKDDWSGDDHTLRNMYSEHGAGVLEIKNVDLFVFRKDWQVGDDDSYEAPAHIELQVQHQLACIARTWAAIGVLIGGNRLELLIRERDDEVNQAIAKKCEKFWSDLAKGVLPPIELPADADIISKLYKYAEPGKVLDANDSAEIAALCAEYRAAADAAKAADDIKKSARAKLLMQIGDHEQVLTKGFKISAGVVAAAEISYTREAYRNVRITAIKPPAEKSAKAKKAKAEGVEA